MPLEKKKFKKKKMAERVHVGVDVGTRGARAVATDPNGVIIARAEAPIDLIECREPSTSTLLRTYSFEGILDAVSDAISSVTAQCKEQFVALKIYMLVSFVFPRACD